MRRVASFAFLSLCVSTSVWAQDISENPSEQTGDHPEAQIPYENQKDTRVASQTEPGIAMQEAPTTPTTPMSMAREEVREPLTFRNEVFALRPSAGPMVYKDATNSTTTRALYGLTADWNFAGALMNNSSLFAGITTGGLFSHLGSATSDFWGTSPSSIVNSAGANMVLIPGNIKVGYNFGETARISAHGGGNVIYRSEGISMNVGPSTATTSPIWRVYPNVGGDIDFAIVRGMTLGIRPDYTFTPGSNIFVGTVSLGLSIG